MSQEEELLAAGERWLREQLLSLRGTIRIGDSTISFGEPAIRYEYVMIGLVILVLVLARKG